MRRDQWSAVGLAVERFAGTSSKGRGVEGSVKQRLLVERVDCGVDIGDIYGASDTYC